MPYKYFDIKRKLAKLWYSIVRQKWSHVMFSDGKTTFPVPNHGGKDISPWVESKIIRLVGLAKKDFDKL